MKYSAIVLALTTLSYGKKTNREKGINQVEAQDSFSDTTGPQSLQAAFAPPQAIQNSPTASQSSQDADPLARPSPAYDGPYSPPSGVVIPDDLALFDKEVSDTSHFRPPPILKYTQQPPNNKGLVPGDVFGLITVSNDRNINGQTVIKYQDGTLGIKEPSGLGYLFEATLFPEYELLIVPEPLSTVKLNDQRVFFVNDSLFNPAAMFSSEGWTLLTDGSYNVVCPSWNSVLVNVDDGGSPPCSDAVGVSLGITPIMV